MGRADNKRGVSRATYATTYITGETLPTCEQHAKMALRSGAIAVPLPADVLVDEDLSPAAVRDLLQTASVIRRADPPAALPSGVEFSGSIVISRSGSGLRLDVVSSGGSHPDGEASR